MNKQDPKYLVAKKKVERLKAFYIHLVVYLFVNAFLFFIDYRDGSNYWFFWPLFGWGIGLAAHGLSVLGGGLFSKEWEEKKIKQYMDRD